MTRSILVFGEVGRYLRIPVEYEFERDKQILIERIETAFSLEFSHEEEKS